MTRHITLGDFILEVRFKDIKHLHLSVHPPEGTVTVAAPVRTDLEVIRAFAIKKIGWIRRERRRLQQANRAAQLEYLERESHYVWGQRYLLRIESSRNGEMVALGPNYLTLHVDPSADTRDKAAILTKWYRGLVRKEADHLIPRWALALGVKVPKVRVRHMKTKWGSCNHRTSSILINTDLAKKPKSFLEYVVLHEMVHLFEPTHNNRFTQMMDRLMPMWRTRRDLLNALPTPAKAEE